MKEHTLVEWYERVARVFAVAGVVALGLAVVVAAPAGAASARQGPTCQSVELPVQLDVAIPVHVSGELCRPSATTAPSSVQVLSAGATYNTSYWNPDVKPERYSYVQAAAEAGHATFNLDRVGYGKSTRVPSALLTSSTQANVLHQVIQALRHEQVGGTAFNKVVSVAHSVGSAVAEIEASVYHDVDGLVLTGFSHHFDAANLADVFTGHVYPAPLDPKFAHTSMDMGYVTTRPGNGGRADIFYGSGDVDPAVIAADEKHKDTSSITEIADAYSVGFTLPISRSIDVPVLIVNGTNDYIFCRGLTSSHCRTSAQFTASESPYFSPAAQLETHVLPGAGHSIALSERYAEEFQNSVTDWIGNKLGITG